MSDVGDPHAVHSVLREKIVERVFTGELLRHLWRIGRYDVEVLYSDFDAYGYDIVVSLGDVIRHIQLKAGVRPASQKVSLSTRLARKPSPGAIWISVDRDLEIQRYFWFGGEPGSPIPGMDDFRSARRPTHNKLGERPERSAHRDVPASAWTPLATLKDVVARLFGQASAKPVCD